MPNAVREGINELGRFADIDVFKIGQLHSGARLVADHLRSMITARPFTDFLYESKEFRRELAAALARLPIDVVHVDSLDLAAYLRHLSNLPTVCVHHNIESLLLRRRAAAEASWMRRRYIDYQGSLVERTERRWCPRVALNIAVSEHDAEALRLIAPGSRTEVVPNGVDVDAFRPEGDGNDGAVFVGGSTWFPNRDALNFFCESILPGIRRALPDSRVRWVGAAREEDIRRYKSEYNVELSGYVPDIRPHVHAAGCFIVPLRVGGGSRLKILDAWAMGKAVVSTSVGCEGLAAKDGENILIRDTAEGFGDAVKHVLSNSDVRRRLGASGRRTAEAFYGWEAIGRRMIPLYEGVLAESRRHRILGSGNKRGTT